MQMYGSFEGFPLTSALFELEKITPGKSMTFAKVFNALVALCRFSWPCESRKGVRDEAEAVFEL